MVLAVITTEPAAMYRPPPFADPPGAGPGLAAGMIVGLSAPVTLLLLVVPPLNRATSADVATPPPLTAALLLVMVELAISRRMEDAALQRPPPLPVAVLPEMVEWVMVTTDGCSGLDPGSPPGCRAWFDNVA